MLDFLNARIITMQYPLVILLIIVSFQAVRAFKEKAFYYLALAWITNLLYLITTEHSPQAPFPTSGVSKYLGTSPEILDFISSALFWYAARKYGAGKWTFYLRWLSTPYFIALLLAAHVTSTSLEHILFQGRYLNFFFASLPLVLVDTLSLLALSFYFKGLVERIKGSTSSVHLLHSGAAFYACIQPFQLLLHPVVKHNLNIKMVAFILGFAAKGAILFGTTSLIVASAAALTYSIAEQRRTRELTVTIDRLAHELGTPIAEIHNGLVALSVARKADMQIMLDKLQNAAARAVAIVGASPFAASPSESSASSSSVAGLTDNFNKTQTVNLNTMVEIAQSSVKATRVEKVTYQHRYSSRCCVECRPAELVQILVNILRNSHDALKYSRGTIKIHTINERCHDGEALTYPHGKIKLIVQDNGEGVRQELIEKIFEEGYSTRRGTGRGFGLAITKKLVEKHRGTIEVHSPPTYGSSSEREGTEVILTLPRVPCLSR